MLEGVIRVRICARCQAQQRREVERLGEREQRAALARSLEVSISNKSVIWLERILASESLLMHLRLRSYTKNRSQLASCEALRVYVP